MIEKDHRNPEYWILRIRTHDWAEHQRVSLLDIHGVGRAAMRALWKLGINTASLLRDADPDQLAQQLKAFGLPQSEPDRAAEIVRGWQEQIRRLEAVRRATDAGPPGPTADK